MQQVDRMIELLKYLPKNDQILGNEFIKSRNFESLKELVDSAIYLVKKHKARKEQDSTLPFKEDYANADLSELNNLKAEVDVYLAQLEFSTNTWENDIKEENYYGEEY